MRVGVVKASTLARLGTWSPRVVLPIVEEAEKRGLDVDTDIEGVEQCRQDINLMQEIEQKQRVLPLPKL